MSLTALRSLAMAAVALAVVVVLADTRQTTDDVAHQKFTDVTTVVARPRLPAPTVTATTAPAQPAISRAAPGVIAKQTTSAPPG